MMTPVDPLLVWGLYLRLLAAVQCIALLSIRSQLLALAGSRGATPVASTLQQVARDFGSWRERLLRFPTLLWLGTSDTALLRLADFGLACALAGVLGLFGCSPLWMLGVWAVLLSFDDAVGLKYPWDSLILEATSLAVFMPPLLPVQLGPHVGSVPHPWLAWSVRLLLFRLMLGFGKLKFVGSKIFGTDACYIHSFLVSLPLPTPLGWWAHRVVPFPFWIVALVGMFVVEIVVPFFFFATGSWRVGAGVAVFALQLGIQATGNFGHFNILTSVLCLSLLDANASVFDGGWAWGLVPSASWAPGAVVVAYVVMHTICAAFYFPFNSWCSTSCFSWPMISVPTHRFVEALQLLGGRLRLVHAYGVFPPKANPPVRWAQVLEGSADGHKWEEYEWAYMTTNEQSPPRFVAPHHPRLDHSIFYTAVGVDPENLGGTAVLSSPYCFSPQTLTHRVMQRLLEGNSPVQSLFRTNPFPSSRGAPKFVRSTLYVFQPHFNGGQKGLWWHRRRVGVHIAPRRDEGDLWQHYPQPCDMSHPEVLPALTRQTEHLRALCTTPGVTSQSAGVFDGLNLERAVFWEVAAFIGDKQHWGVWENGAVTRRAIALRQRFGVDTLREVHRAWGRLTALFMRRHEPHFKSFTPEQRRVPYIDLSSFFMYGMVAHHFIAQGEQAYDEALADVSIVVSVAREYDTAAGDSALAQVAPRALYFYAIMSHDTLLYHARKFRLQAAIAPRDAPPLPTGGVLPGFLEFAPFLVQQLIDVADIDSAIERDQVERAEPKYFAEALPRMISPEPLGMWQVELPGCA